MLTSIALAVGLVVAIPVPEGPEPVELFAAEGWYKEQAGKEQDFTGILVEIGRGGRAGFGRQNPYRLLIEGDKPDLREVYVGGKPDALRAFVGKRVKLTGKAVDMEVERSQHREVWPARLVVLDAEMPPAKVQERLLAAVRKQLDVEQVRLKQMQDGLNVPVLDGEQAVRMKFQMRDAMLRVQELQAKVAELEQPAGGVGAAPAEAEALKREVLQQRAAAEAAQQQMIEVRRKLAAIAQQNPAPEDLKKVAAFLAESQARVAAEQAKLAELEARYQRALRLPRPDTIPPQGNAGDVERLRALVEALEATQAEAVALAQKARLVNDPNVARELLQKQDALQQQRDAIAKEIAKLRGGK